jgi:hypothetical protein
MIEDVALTPSNCAIGEKRSAHLSLAAARLTGPPPHRGFAVTYAAGPLGRCQGWYADRHLGSSVASVEV